MVRLLGFLGIGFVAGIASGVAHYLFAGSILWAVGVGYGVAILATLAAIAIAYLLDVAMSNAKAPSARPDPAQRSRVAQASTTATSSEHGL